MSHSDTDNELRDFLTYLLSKASSQDWQSGGVQYNMLLLLYQLCKRTAVLHLLLHLLNLLLNLLAQISINLDHSSHRLSAKACITDASYVDQTSIVRIH